jgi:magnesium transporter
MPRELRTRAKSACQEVVNLVRNDTPDGRSSPLEDADIHTLVSGTERLAPTITDVVDAEEAANAVSSEGPGIVAWLFREDAKPAQVSLEELPTLAADDACFVWVDLSGYDPSDLTHVAELLDLPEAAVQVALAGWQRPRLEVFRDRFFVAVTVPHGEFAAQRVLASELDLFVGRNYLVSAHKRPLPFTERVLARAVQNPALLKLDSAFLLSILIDELLAHYEVLTEELEDEIEGMEVRALSDASDALLEDLLHLKRFVFAVYRLASQHRATLEAFLRPDFPLVGGDVIEPYFRDLDERLGRLLDALGAAKESVNGSFDLYVSQVAHRTNDIMRVLTIVSVTLLPASVIIGLFGTDFESPRLGTATGFIVMVVLIVLTTVGALVLFKRRGWIGAAERESVRAVRPEP